MHLWLTGVEFSPHCKTYTDFYHKLPCLGSLLHLDKHTGHSGTIISVHFKP